MLDFGMNPIAPEDLLVLVEQFIAKTTGLGDKCFLSLWPEKFFLGNPRATQFATIVPSNFPVWQSVVDGSGWDNPLTGYNAVVTINVYVLNTADPETWSVNLIREQVLGLTQLVSKIAAQIQGWVPQNSSDGVLVREPARMPDSGWRYETVDVKGNIWAKASISMEIKFSTLLPNRVDVTVREPTP